jgi:hypothetical protein
LAAFAGKLSRLGEPGAVHDAAAAAAAARYAVAVCRGSQALLRSLDALGKWPAVVGVVDQEVTATRSRLASPRVGPSAAAQAGAVQGGAENTARAVHLATHRGAAAPPAMSLAGCKAN